MKKLLLLILSAVILTMCLTACGDNSSNSDSSNIILTDEEKKSKLDIANDHAREVFISITNNTNDILVEGGTPNDLITDKVVAVDSFEDSNDPIEQAVYKFFSKLDKKGYIYIYFKNNSTDSFVHWSEDKSGTIIGQYPSPKRNVDKTQEVEFGEFKDE